MAHRFSELQYLGFKYVRGEWIVSYNGRSYTDIGTLSEMTKSYRDLRVEKKTYSKGGGALQAAASCFWRVPLAEIGFYIYLTFFLDYSECLRYICGVNGKIRGVEILALGISGP